jgi:hypothetical protein
VKGALGSLVMLVTLGIAGCGSGTPIAGGHNDGGAGAAAGRAGAGGAGGEQGMAGATAGAAGTGGPAGQGGGAAGAGGGIAGAAGGAAGAAGATAGSAGGGMAGATAGAAGGGMAGATAGSAGHGGTGGGGAAGAAGAHGDSCTTPTDCAGTPPGDASTFCSAPSWSCVGGRCSWECMGGRSCAVAADSGCLRCRTSPTGMPTSEGCLGATCAIDKTGITTVTQLTCKSSPPPDFSTWHCTGNWAVPANGGTPCTIQSLASGVFRVSVTCGACVTIVAEN